MKTEHAAIRTHMPIDFIDGEDFLPYPICCPAILSCYYPVCSFNRLNNIKIFNPTKAAV